MMNVRIEKNDDRYTERFQIGLTYIQTFTFYEIIHTHMIFHKYIFDALSTSITFICSLV